MPDFPQRLFPLHPLKKPKKQTTPPTKSNQNKKPTKKTHHKNKQTNKQNPQPNQIKKLSTPQILLWSLMLKAELYPEFAYCC